MNGWVSAAEKFRAGAPARFVAAHEATAYMYGSEAADWNDEPQGRHIRDVRRPWQDRRTLIELAAAALRRQGLAVLLMAFAQLVKTMRDNRNV